MNRSDWTPDLVIAAGVIIGGFTMKLLGIDGEVWAGVILALGWVFGKQFEKRRRNHKQVVKD